MLGNERYEVEKVGECEGPKHTMSSADSMKWWVVGEELSPDETDEKQTVEEQTFEE